MHPGAEPPQGRRIQGCPPFPSLAASSFLFPFFSCSPTGRSIRELRLHRVFASRAALHSPPLRPPLFCSPFSLAARRVEASGSSASTGSSHPGLPLMPLAALDHATARGGVGGGGGVGPGPPALHLYYLLIYPRVARESPRSSVCCPSVDVGGVKYRFFFV